MEELESTETRLELKDGAADKISKLMERWKNRLTLDNIRFIERFNRSYREEVLNAYVFTDLHEVRQISREWLRSYNEERPHDALGSLPPVLYRERVLAVKNSTSELST